METVRIGVVGLGNMGSHHAAYLAAGGVTGATLAAVCDVDLARLAAARGKAGVPGFATPGELLRSGTVDAVIVASPHYDHPPTVLAAFEAGVHALCEKPVAVSVAAARRVNAAAADVPHLTFGVMFNQRTNPLYQRFRELIADGELGEVTRVTWIATDWFRTWAYYASGGWRATWAGEGGGVLINQCPHNLDLLQWVPGLMPGRVTAVAALGKTHPIEVEDEVSAILEYPTGAIGHFVTTTGEAPGNNRLEVCGDRGRLVAENGTLLFRRTRRGVRQTRETSPLAFAPVETWDCDIPLGPKAPDEHRAITQNFVDAITKGTPLLAPGVEAVRGLEIGNAMLLAGVTRTPVELPLDGDRYDAFLLDLVRDRDRAMTAATKVASSADTAATPVF